MASLAVVDPSSLFRAGLAALVRTTGFAPVFEAADLDELKRREPGEARPDLVLLGAPRRAADAGPLVSEIRAWAPAAKVVFIVPRLDLQALVASFAGGASGYLMDSISPDALKHSLDLVSVGENVFPSDLATLIAAPHFLGPDDSGGELKAPSLTDREVEILRHLAAGQSNHAIAETLELSDAAVGADIRQLLRKLRVSNRTQAALWAVSRGLASPGGD